MLQIINMFWLAVVLWLIIEVINIRINRSREMQKNSDDFNDKK